VVGALTASCGPNSHGHTGFNSHTAVDSGHIIAGSLKATDGGADTESAHHLVAYGGNNTAGPIDVAPACRAHGTFHYDFESEAFLAGPPITFKASHFTRGKDGAPTEVSPPLSADADKGDQDNLVLAPLGFQSQMSGTQSATNAVDMSPTISAKSRMGVAGGDMAVRRFTPLECERLQGFPDFYTLVPYRARRAKDFDHWYDYLKARLDVTRDEAVHLAADGPRYKAIGNSWAIPCVRWIGERIEAVERAMQ
jgi:DNA (cytosine-5)-methyltransferase 1